MSKQRVIVTGGSGLLGRALIKELKTGDKFEVLGLAFSRAKDGLVKVDLNNKDEVAKVLNDFKPSLVVHAAAQRAPDQFDKDYDASYKLNVAVSRSLAEMCSQLSIELIHISTDYVFDGTSPPYSETDTTNPVNAYGQSKADAEKAVAEASSHKAAILRLPVLYGDEEYLGESAISGLLATLLDSSKAKKVSSYEVRRPACLSDVAFVISRLVAMKLEDPSGVSGIYQWNGLEVLTKYDMVRIMSQEFGLSMDHIEADLSPGTGTPRPRDVTLSRARVEALGIARDTPFAENVRKYFSKFVEATKLK